MRVELGGNEEPEEELEELLGSDLEEDGRPSFHENPVTGYKFASSPDINNGWFLESLTKNGWEFERRVVTEKGEWTEINVIARSKTQKDKTKGREDAPLVECHYTFGLGLHSSCEKNNSSFVSLSLVIDGIIQDSAYYDQHGLEAFALNQGIHKSSSALHALEVLQQDFVDAGAVRSTKDTQEEGEKSQSEILAEAGKVVKLAGQARYIRTLHSVQKISGEPVIDIALTPCYYRINKGRKRRIGKRFYFNERFYEVCGPDKGMFKVVEIKPSIDGEKVKKQIIVPERIEQETIDAAKSIDDAWIKTPLLCPVSFKSD